MDNIGEHPGIRHKNAVYPYIKYGINKEHQIMVQKDKELGCSDTSSGDT